MAGFAVGAWELPDDGITKVHKGETILNATDSNKFRKAAENMDGGGAGGGGDMHLHISAVDAEGVRRLMMDNGGALVRSIQAQARNFRGVATR